jgi:hypothetical protein
MSNSEYEPETNPKAGIGLTSHLSFPQIQITIFCFFGLILMGISSLLTEEEDIGSQALLVVISGVFFILFVFTLAKWHRSERDIYKKGIFSLWIAFLIVVIEVIFKLFGGMGLFHIIVLDVINGYVCLKTRRLLLPIASRIIDRYGEDTAGRARFSYVLITFGILLMALQVITIIAFFRHVEMDIYLFLLVSCFQCVSFYWGFVIARLGMAINQGYEPEFAKKARTRIEALEEALARRRETAIILAHADPDKRENMVEQAFAQFSEGETYKVHPYMNIRSLILILIGIGIGVSCLIAFMDRKDAVLGISGVVGILLACGGVYLLYREHKVKKENYIEFSSPGIRLHGPQIKYSCRENPMNVTRFLWIEFFKFDGVASMYHFRESVVLQGYLMGVRLTFNSRKISLDSIARGVKKFIDDPLLLSDEMDLIPLDDYFITEEELNRGGPEK